MTRKAPARDAILEAADQLFADYGYDGVSTRDITTKAGVTKATLFYHFNDKDGLYQTILQRYYSAHKKALEDALDQPGDLSQRLHAVIDAYTDFITKNVRYARMVQRQIASGKKDLTVIHENLASLFDAVQAPLSEITPASGPLAARHFFVTLSGAVLNYFTYAPALTALWDDDALTDAAIAERRAHLHWLLDTLLAGLTTPK